MEEVLVGPLQNLNELILDLRSDSLVLVIATTSLFQSRAAYGTDDFFSKVNTYACVCPKLDGFLIIYEVQPVGNLSNFVILPMSRREPSIIGVCSDHHEAKFQRVNLQIDMEQIANEALEL